MRSFFRGGVRHNGRFVSRSVVVGGEARQSARDFSEGGGRRGITLYYDLPGRERGGVGVLYLWRRRIQKGGKLSANSKEVKLIWRIKDKRRSLTPPY